MSILYSVLAQMDVSKANDGAPPFTGETHDAMVWMLVGLLTVLILLVTFKTSRRNALDPV